jgi:hypothetical protein
MPKADGGDAATTAALTRPDPTREMPPVEPEPDRWSASAAVPVPGAPPIGAISDGYDNGLLPVEDGARSWATPLLIGLAAAVLFGALMAGLWLIFTARDGGAPGQNATSAPPAPSTSTPPSSAPPTSAAPTSQPPTTAAPGSVVPPLIGLSEAEARQRLTDAGLRVDVVHRTDPSAQPGTVIGSIPDQGAAVPPNSVVRIVVASPPQPSSPRPSTSSG